MALTTSPEAFDASDPDAGVRVAALYEAHGRTVLGLCRFLLRDATEAEDAAQQAFLSAYRSLLGGAEPREPAAWLAAIARNECWGRIKRRMREPLALHEAPSELPDPLEVAVRNADLAALRQGLVDLSRPQREAFLLREFAGLSYGELATALGVTEPAVDSLLFRARTRLRRVLSAANAVLVPVALRDQLGQLIPGFDQPATGTLAKLASLPVAAKLAAAGAGAVLVVAGSTGLDRHAATSARTSAPALARPVQRSVTAVPRSSRSAPGVLSLPRSSAARRAPVASTDRAARAHDRVASPQPASRPGDDRDSLANAQSSTDASPSDPRPAPTAVPPATDDGSGVTRTLDGAAAPAAGTSDDASRDRSLAEPDGSGSDGSSSESSDTPESPEEPETSTTTAPGG